jgi:hypothetical protein
MNSPTAVIHTRILVWGPVLAQGTGVREKFDAGKASISIIITPNVPGDLGQGLAVLEQKLVAAANAAQAPGTKIEVKVEPLAMLGLQAAAEVLGPAQSA